MKLETIISFLCLIAQCILSIIIIQGDGGTLTVLFHGVNTGIWLATFINSL
jgi:hypothetical protein